MFSYISFYDLKKLLKKDDIINGLYGRKIDNIFIDNILKWIYHNNTDLIIILDVVINYDLNSLFEYYYICNYLQISELLEICNKVLKKYFNLLYNFKANLEDILLDEKNNSYNNYYFKFKKDDYYVDVGDHLNFITLIKPIIIKLNE